MITINNEEVRAHLPFPELIEGLRRAFANNPDVPARQHLRVPLEKQQDATLLLMPAWDSLYVGVKIATVFPDNGKKRLPAVDAIYILKNGSTGQSLAVLDGTELTRIRTAAASALASTFLSRKKSSNLLMIGAGALAAPLIRAHCCVRPIEKVWVWNRSPAKLETLRQELESEFELTIVTDLQEAISNADIITCATMSDTPLVHGKDVKPGAHIDLVGAYLPTMRESDAPLIATSKVFVDTRHGACAEGGDLVQAAKESAFSMNDIQAELSELCQQTHSGRKSETEVTVFKSVGASLEDLVAASIVYNRFQS